MEPDSPAAPSHSYPAVRKGTAHLIAGQVLVQINSDLHRKLYGSASELSNLSSSRVTPALEWALAELAARRPAQPVSALVDLLREFEASRMLASLGVQLPPSSRSSTL